MSPGNLVIITGTDTGVGKTVLTALLLHHLRTNGVDALAMKPFCSGSRHDVELLAAVQENDLPPETITPYFFTAPVAPLIGARQEHRRIPLRDVLQSIREAQDSCEVLLVEGAGGLMAPLGEGFSILDIIASMTCRVVIVARNRLGTVNHTLLTLSALTRIPAGTSFPNARSKKARSAPASRPADLQVVLMAERDPDESAQSNAALIEELIDPVPLFQLPFLRGKLSTARAIASHYAKIAPALQSVSLKFD